jgi:hypothetical protein
MNQKNIAIAAIIAAALLTGIFSTTTPMAAYAGGNDDHDDNDHDHNDDYNGRDGGDESETNTEQRLKQKNVGSGESTNFNCGENSIESAIDIQACGTADVGDGGDGIGRVTLCHNPDGPSPQTLTLPPQAVPAHLAHGDHLGPCLT